MSISTIAIIAGVCLIVGLLIGWSGIAGFLLPIFFTGSLNLSVPESLSISFLCFFLSGCIGAYSYHKQDFLPLRPSLILSTGSLVGAVIGVSISRYIPTHIFMFILYLVVLLSGLSILIREWKGHANARNAKEEKRTPPPSTAKLLVLGCITAAICALSGAGGPVLVMPILLLCGFHAKEAVGMALFNSIFIAIPSFVGYSLRCDLRDVLDILLICVISHGVGILIGGKTSQWIPVNVLKIGVAVFSIGIAIFKLC